MTNVYYGSFTLGKQGVLIQGQATAANVTPTMLNFGQISVATTSSPMNVTFQMRGRLRLRFQAPASPAAPILGGGYNYHDLSVLDRVGSGEFHLHLQFYIHAAPGWNIQGDIQHRRPRSDWNAEDYA